MAKNNFWFCHTSCINRARHFDNYLWPIQLKTSYKSFKAISRARSLGLYRIISSEGCGTSNFTDTPALLSAPVPANRNVKSSCMTWKPAAFLIWLTGLEFQQVHLEVSKDKENLTYLRTQVFSKPDPYWLEPEPLYLNICLFRIILVIQFLFTMQKIITECIIFLLHPAGEEDRDASSTPLFGLTGSQVLRFLTLCS